MLSFSTIIIFNCVLAFVLQSVATVDATTTHTFNEDADNEEEKNSCWSTNECLIEAKLQLFSGNVLPIIVNCSMSGNLISESNNFLMKRRLYANISAVMLDGCGAALNANTFGFEYIPNCGMITSLNLKNFHFDEIYEIICESGTSLENVYFEHNEFARVSATSVANLKDLKTLHFYDNKLRYIDGEAFSGLKRLKELKVVDENRLRVSYAKMFKNLLHLERLHVDGVDKVTSELLLNLPDNLDELKINRAIFDKDDVDVVAPPPLRNLTITNCALTSVTIRGHEMLLLANLSGNLLSEFFLENCTHLEILDLGANNLTQLSSEQFDQLEHIHHVLLRRNKLKTISMLVFGNALTHMHSIDLRDNQLQHINDFNESLAVDTHLRVLIGGNPWNCIWLVNVSFMLPEQYRVFRYEKFISKINVNGLECVTYPEESGPEDLKASQKNNLTSPFHAIYVSPREVKRNQKAEALVIVFMLPLGIALLFVLLYLWINCQKVFHLSYYRNLPLMRGSAERFDVVRQIPLTNSPDEGYEIPLTGCNCDDHIGKKCNKVNITYEETPQNNAAKIYEEIIDQTGPPGNCYYDHLKYVEQNRDSL